VADLQLVTDAMLEPAHGVFSPLVGQCDTDGRLLRVLDDDDGARHRRTGVIVNDTPMYGV
jgi:hypothetical protein